MTDENKAARGSRRMDKDAEGSRRGGRMCGSKMVAPKLYRSFIRVGPGEHDFGPVFSSKWLGWTKGASWCVFS